jgi:hypothetical protein
MAPAGRAPDSRLESRLAAVFVGGERANVSVTLFDPERRNAVSGQLQGSCPKSVVDDRHFRGNELWSGGLREISPRAGDRAAFGNPKAAGVPAVLDFRELVRIRAPRRNFRARLSVQNPPQKGSTTTRTTFRLFLNTDAESGG